MDLRVPKVNIAGRWDRSGLGAFLSDAAFEHFLGAYRAGMATLPPFELFDVPTSFGTVRAYRFAGPDAGPPVVLLPGRNASTPMYQTNLGPLLQRSTVYGVDLLGEAGLSVQDKVIRGAPDQAQWLDEALAGLDLEKAHLLGVSMGGWTAANCAAHRPGRIASLTLLDPVFTFTGAPAKAILASVALFAPGIPERWRRRVQSWIAGGADISDAETEAALISAGSTDFTLRTPAPKLFTDEQLRNLDVPVLALIAGRSVMLNPPRAVERARELLPRGQVELWADASHAINGEYPEEIARRAGRFWDEV
ncbi:alpha/beta fold hydrolase [Mycolicibacterium neworleansense]|uniref:Carboxylesterase n=1 Tax=Mycolicibacterium neworleansense TaxID=146018 RepID=A0A0H5RR60_9MYCO|nr:alpha/beta hydrolase [Mycolicibacterium neworleansense]MCV7365159.1 alpha/beta hydrolase [Mycolicibacterium neworleansense]CRZ15962.1 carboxylesterase [Mycolicibacterium neworleansense]